MWRQCEGCVCGGSVRGVCVWRQCEGCVCVWRQCEGCVCVEAV